MIRDDRFQYIVNYSSTPRGGTNERARQPDDRYAANAEKLDVLPLLAAHPERPEVRPFVDLILAPRPREELYGGVADPDQLQNLADKPEFAEVKQKLRARLETYQRQTHDPRITGDMAIFAETLRFVEGAKPPVTPTPKRPGPRPPEKDRSPNEITPHTPHHPAARAAGRAARRGAGRMSC